MNAEALLGPLPVGWSRQERLDSRGHYMTGSLNASTQEWIPAEDDPRLGPRLEDWDFIPESKWSNQKPKKYNYQEWKNQATGRIVNSDPRLSPKALKQRGVELIDFQLV